MKLYVDQRNFRNNGPGRFVDPWLGERGAITLARRIINPIGELVKVNPESMGIGRDYPIVWVDSVPPTHFHQSVDI